MKLKNFLIAGAIGGFANFMLGWLFYGIVFPNIYPKPEGGKENMLFIFLGCMTFGFFMSYVFTKWTSITNYMTGLKSGAIFGLFLGLYSNFFMHGLEATPNMQNFVLDVLINTFLGAIVGAFIAVVNRKL